MAGLKRATTMRIRLCVFLYEIDTNGDQKVFSLFLFKAAIMIQPSPAFQMMP